MGTVIVLILVAIVLVFGFAIWLLETFWWLIILAGIGGIWFHKKKKREQEEFKKKVAREDDWLEPQFLPKVHAVAKRIATVYENEDATVLYTLQLRERKYYVGLISSHDFENRMSKHFNGDGALWTKKYKPVYLSSVTVLENMEWSEAEEFEDAQTLKVMEMHGCADVRGGHFTAVDWNEFSHWLRQHGYALVKERKGPFSHLLKVRPPGKELHWKRLSETLTSWEKRTDEKLKIVGKRENKDKAEQTSILGDDRIPTLEELFSEFKKRRDH